MSYVPKSDGGDWPKVDTGAYVARIEECEEVDGTYGPQFRFKLNLGNVETVTGDLDEVTLFAYASQKFVGGKKPSNLWKIAAAAGIDCENAAGIDPDADLVGRSIRVLVTCEPSTKGEGVWNRVTDFAPVKAGKTAPAAKPAANGATAAAQPVNGDPWE